MTPTVPAQGMAIAYGLDCWRFWESERSLTSFGMTALAALAHRANPNTIVIPNVVRDLSLRGARHSSGALMSATGVARSDE